MSEDDLYALAELSAKKERSVMKMGPIPQTVLSLGIGFDGPEIIWYRPFGMASLKFSEDTGIKSGKYMVPSLVFHYKKGELSVVATMDIDKWPTLESKAYYAPFSNITDASVCMGTSEPEHSIDTIAELIEAWEDGFIHGEFTHNEKGRTKCKDLKKYYEQVDFKNLKKTGETVEEALSS